MTKLPPLLVSHVRATWATRGQSPSVHVWPTQSTCGSHGKGSFWSFVSLSLISFKCIPIPSHSCVKQNSKSEYFLQFLVSCFDHNFFIRTRNWVIQKRTVLVSKRSTNPNQFQRHLISAFCLSEQICSTNSCVVCDLLLFILSCALIFLFDWWNMLRMMLDHILGLDDRLIWVLALWFDLSIYWLNLSFSWNWF